MSSLQRLTPLPNIAARHWSLALVLALFLGLGATALRADPQPRIFAMDGVALAGYDPVAYFTQGRPMRGDPSIALRWRGILWQFAEPKHRAAFEANPRAYVPQLGGFCAVSMSQGITRPSDPEQWVIHEGRLYLVETAIQRNQFMAQPAVTLDLAGQHWPKARAIQSQ